MNGLRQKTKGKGETARLRQHGLATLCITLILLLGLVFWGDGFNPAGQAMTGTVVRLDPPSVQIDPGETTTIDIIIQDVEGLYGGDVQLAFDPTVIEILDADPIAPGIQIQTGTAPSPDWRVKNEADNTTGRIWYAVLQLNPTLPFTGTGTMASITLRGLAEGSTALAFTYHLLGNRDGEEIPATTQDGSVTVGSPSMVDTPTPTTTNYPQAPLSETVPPPTPTATKGPVSFSISPSSKTVGNGSTFWLQIRIDTHGQPIAGAQAYVHYDTNYLDILNVTTGSTLGMIQAVKDDPAGWCGLSAGDPYGPTVSGNFVLGNLQFRATNLNPSGVTLQFGTYGSLTTKASLEGYSYPSDTHSGKVYIVEATNTPIATQGPTSTPEPTLPAGSICLRRGVNAYDGVEDTYISSWDPLENFGDALDLQLRSIGVKRVLIRFDLSDFPPGTTIYEASLDLRTNYYRSRTDSIPVEIYRMKQEWSEDEATWRERLAGQEWDDPGADGVDDRYPDPVATLVLDTVNTWYSVDLTDLVQDWVANPGSNYGLMLDGVEVTNEYRFWSSDYTSVSLRPELCLTYLIATATPTTTPTETPTPTLTPSPTLEVTLTPTFTPSPTVTPTSTPVYLYLPLILL